MLAVPLGYYWWGFPVKGDLSLPVAVSLWPSAIVHIFIIFCRRLGAPLKCCFPFFPCTRYKKYLCQSFYHKLRELPTKQGKFDFCQFIWCTQAFPMELKLPNYAIFLSDNLLSEWSRFRYAEYRSSGLWDLLLFLKRFI